MLPNFIDLPGSWSILPQSLADILVKRNDKLVYDIITENPPPARTAYILQYKYSKPWVKELSSLFLADVIKMIRSTPALQLIYTA